MEMLPLLGAQGEVMEEATLGDRSLGPCRDGPQGRRPESQTLFLAVWPCGVLQNDADTPRACLTVWVLRQGLPIG